MSSPQDLLAKYWGHDSFKNSQENVIDKILEGNDVLALLPTGGGKSVCFQIPALYQQGLCVVISPLIALMQAQVDNLKSKNIKAIALTGAMTQDELSQAFDNCLYGGYKFLYLSPERLQQTLVLSRLRELEVNLIAIDEAHCISQWGNDFRPAYLNCGSIRELFPEIPVIAVTATATPRVVEDIKTSIPLKRNAVLIQDSFARPNIGLIVRKEENKRQALLELCAKSKSSIIYVRSRRLSETLAGFLEQHGVSAGFYHGGLRLSDKKNTLKNWVSNKIKVVVATNAFGMGIDKADVQLVIHYQIPDSIESYYQEAGRAGRNGKSAKAILLLDKTDDTNLKRQFLDSMPELKYLHKIYHKLNSYFQIPYGELLTESHPFNLNDFCELYQFNTYKAIKALEILEQHSILAIKPESESKSTLKIIASKSALWDFLNSNPNDGKIIQTILRTYGGLFDFPTVINTTKIAKKTNQQESKILTILRAMKTSGLAEFEEKHCDLEIIFLVPREDDRTLNRIAGDIKQLRDRKKNQIEDILSYITYSSGCRQRWILNYFGEQNTHDCGICDCCIRSTDKSHNSQEISSGIKSVLEEGSLSSRAIVNQLPYNRNKVLHALQVLIESGDIKIDQCNEYYMRDEEA